MKTMVLGSWESDLLYKNTVTASWQTPSKQIFIRGYQFSIGMRSSGAPGLFTNNGTADILWFCTLNPGTWDPTDNWGPIVLKDNTGTSQNLHGTNSSGNQLAACILKASPWYVSVNKIISIMGLNISVTANSSLSQFAGHGGQGPCDIEVQGVLFYD